MNDKKPRVRFAPSPTGHLHVGGARTALYNWLFARGRGGSFILRIEDTDLSRSTDESIQQIISSMRWLGLDWDEGPGAAGDHGPYRQMERMDIYQEAASALLDAGRAYHCYCSPEELEAARTVARQESRPVVYNGRCCGLSSSELQTMESEGRQPVIRLRTPREGFTVVRDTIKGDVQFENSTIGDFILVRSSGVPTYNFAVAVDDARMGITHVIRGDDHLPNTPRQIMLLEAMGEEPPLYGHLPLILGADKTPLSKRHGASAVEEFRKQGYVREALCNYLALLGWSFDGETTLFSIEELVEKFSLERVGNTAAVFDGEKFIWMNGHYIREMSEGELASRIIEYLAGSDLAGLPGSDGKPTVAELVPLVQEKMKTLADFAALTDFFFLPLVFEEKALGKLMKDANALPVLESVVAAITSLDTFSLESIEERLRAEAEAMELKLGKFLQPIRIAVSGKTITPGMFETLAMLGREESIERLKAAIIRLAQA
ncbi:MAG: glutamate--tRNA ligase [Thermoleophilia bacterium]|nr:glutamate--tRNA ligase [Thermoleophilia bacterium]